jgi:hypothetical protein
VNYSLEGVAENYLAVNIGVLSGTGLSAANIGFRGEADKMLVLKVEDDGSWEEIYYGDFEPVRQIARYSKRARVLGCKHSDLASLSDEELAVKLVKFLRDYH